MELASLKIQAKRWLPALVWSSAIFVFSSLPGADFANTKGTDYFVRKILHILEYSILCLTYYRGSKKILAAVLLGILFAVSDELHQTFVPTRTGKLSDMFIDSFAVLLTGGILWKYYQNLPMKLKNWLSE